MKITDIRKLKTNELMNRANETKVEIAELRRRMGAGETTNVRVIRNKRKDLARILTVISEQLSKEKV